MTRKATNFDEARKGTSPSAAEQAARAGLEARLDRPLSDDEWKRQSQRLREFVKILARWDAEQRAAGRCAKMDSKEWVA